MEIHKPYKKHWSFVVTDKRYMYFLVALLSFAGVVASLSLKNPTYFSRVGNFIMAVGVWISMRYTLREGINKYKDAELSIPVLPGGRVNDKHFNEITFSIGDAQLQLHGMLIVIYGAIVGSFGDIFLEIIMR